MRFCYFLPLILLIQVQVARSKMWRCRNGQLIDESFQCDELSDCMDGSDESSEFCKVKCKEDEFQCVDISQCISNELLCNQFSDCFDRSDESEATCRTLQEDSELLGICPSALFTCDDGSRCLDKDFLCDSTKDCDDGSDELRCGDKLDIVPHAKSAPAKKSKGSVPKVCNKKPHIKKCRRFWDSLKKTLNPKLVRKCDRKPQSKKCMKIKPLLELHKAFMIASGNSKPKISSIPKKCIKKPKRKSCRKYYDLL